MPYRVGPSSAQDVYGRKLTGAVAVGPRLARWRQSLAVYPDRDWYQTRRELHVAGRWLRGDPASVLPYTEKAASRQAQH